MNFFYVFWFDHHHFMGWMNPNGNFHVKAKNKLKLLKDHFDEDEPFNHDWYSEMNKLNLKYLNEHLFSLFCFASKEEQQQKQSLVKTKFMNNE